MSDHSTTRLAAHKPDALSTPTPPSEQPRPDQIRDQGQTEPPQGRARRVANTIIVGFLLLQLAAPATCYVLDRGTDERFCWRMFSTVRMRKCHIAVVEFPREQEVPVPRPVDLRSEVHSAWINSLKRFRRVVVDKFLHWRCERVDMHSVVVTRTCHEPGGGYVPADKLRIECESGKVTELEQAGRPESVP